MKKKASIFFKQIITLLSSIAKAKSLAIKTKTSAVKARLEMLSLVRNKKLLMTSISNKIHNLLGQNHNEDDDGHIQADQTKAIVLYNNATTTQIEEDALRNSGVFLTYGEDDNKYPDLTHSLFEEEEFDFDDQCGSIIDQVRDSKEDGGEDFKLEDEIDHVADLFITRFHKQMRLQKLLSFKRYQQMLERSV